jgi:hypothetical protein
MPETVTAIEQRPHANTRLSPPSRGDSLSQLKLAKTFID